MTFYMFGDGPAVLILSDSEREGSVTQGNDFYWISKLLSKFQISTCFFPFNIYNFFLSISSALNNDQVSVKRENGLLETEKLDTVGRDSPMKFKVEVKKSNYINAFIHEPSTARV